MIISARRFDYDELKQQLDADDKIIVLSCNNCAKKCDGLGGRVGLAALADKLEADGYKVILRELCGIGCSLDMVRERGRNEATAALFEQADVIIPLACEDGEHTAAFVFPTARVLQVTRTLGIGWVSPQAGLRLCAPLAGVELPHTGPEGLSLQEAADHMNLPCGSF
jgi:hypothetical protein